MFRFRVTRWYMVHEGEVFVKIGSVIGEFIAGINRNKTVRGATVGHVKNIVIMILIEAAA
jgi:hypothetical protein